MKFRRIISILLSFSIVLLSSIVGISILNYNKNERFISNLTSIYEQYDKNVNREEIKNNEFAINRLIVADYDGKNYGAIDKAVDKNNSFAVLQFENAKETEKAYNQMKADGYTVDADGFATVDSYEMGEMHPLGSQTVGTKEFSNNFKMAKDDVLVAVIDTGIMLDHPDLENRFYNAGYDFSSDGFDNAYYDTTLETDYYFHGTFVSGVIANNTMDNVKIVPYKVVPFGGNDGEVSAILASINNAVDLGVDVINISISSYSSRDVYYKVVKNAVQNGVCICASAGNKGMQIDSCPASFSEVITVGALNKSCNKVASFSSYGSALDFVAPGSHIISTMPTEDGAGYGEYSGTSFSTPYVTACCADIKSMNKNLSKQEIYDMLCDFSVDFGDEGRDDYYGNGVPNLSNMVYTDNESYNLKLPQGEIEMFGCRNFTIESQPWKAFNEKIKTVNIANDLTEIGNYSFYGLTNAKFYFPVLTSVGSYAFYGCKNLQNITFSTELERIGNNAFGNIRSDFTISGYRNTPAETYSIDEGINFVSLGCKHNYSIDIIEPTGDIEGYTIYTCLVCSDEYIGAYIEPTVVISGKCGENVYYNLYNTGKLMLYGSGEMYSYINEKSPFEEIKNDITRVYITENVSSISPFAFACCNYIKDFYSDNDYISVVDGGLYSNNGKNLIYAYSNDYVMPEYVESFNACSFLKSKVSVNDNFVVQNGLVYDKNNNIIMALPEYKESVLVFENDCIINDFAFLLTDYPNAVRSYAENLIFGDYSIGYSFDGEIYINDFSFYGYDNTSAFEYAKNNGFKANPLNAGECGESLSWRFDLDTNELRIDGTGEMFNYSTKASIPWYDYAEEITSIVVGDEVEALSIYSFFTAYNVKKMTVPLSLKVVESQTVWYGCQNVESIVLTKGTGTMENYGSALRSRLYTYSPWYPSRNSLKSIEISDDVEYIGKYAFRECMALECLTLSNCDVISDGAFYGASNLKKVIIPNKSTIIGNNAFGKTNADFVLSSYMDSVSKDYAFENNISFESLGCEHSRGYNSSGERAVCCYDSNVSYNCSDCNELIYSEYHQAQGNGHYVKATVSTVAGIPINNAEVYIDDVLCAITNDYGKFVAEEIKCEENHFVEVKKNGISLISGYVETNCSNRYGDLSVRFGDYVKDNVVNAKDYAYALKHNFDDKNYLDYGKITQDNIFDISKGYSVQYAPRVLTVYNEQSSEISYRRSFYSEISYNKDYEIQECGFIFGKNMDDDFLVLENVGKLNADGFELKKSSVNKVGTPVFRMDYGSSSKTGKLSARFFIKYTNGVRSYLVYSDITSYRYE